MKNIHRNDVQAIKWKKILTDLKAYVKTWKPIRAIKLKPHNIDSILPLF